MLLITPEILTNFEKYHVCDKSENEGLKLIGTYRVFDAIVAQNPQLAKQKNEGTF
jgi:GntR family transcriptional repressor for pyruvate dehydrogenase complex